MAPFVRPSRRRSSMIQGVNSELLTAMRIASQSNGYSSKDVANFIALYWILQPPMHSEWVKTMEFHLLDSSANCSLFLEASASEEGAMLYPVAHLVSSFLCHVYVSQAVKARLGAAWKSEFIPAVESFYFQAKRTGVQHITEYLPPHEAEEFLAAQQRILQVGGGPWGHARTRLTRHGGVRDASCVCLRAETKRGAGADCGHVSHYGTGGPRHVSLLGVARVSASHTNLCILFEQV